jgi:hypothetical protein
MRAKQEAGMYQLLFLLVSPYYVARIDPALDLDTVRRIWKVLLTCVRYVKAEAKKAAAK